MEAVPKALCIEIITPLQMEMLRFVLQGAGIYGRTLQNKILPLDIQRNSVKMSVKHVGNLQRSQPVIQRLLMQSQESVNVIHFLERLLREELFLAKIQTGC